MVKGPSSATAWAGMVRKGVLYSNATTAMH